MSEQLNPMGLLKAGAMERDRLRGEIGKLEAENAGLREALVNIRGGVADREDAYDIADAALKGSGDE